MVDAEVSVSSFLDLAILDEPLFLDVDRAVDWRAGLNIPAIAVRYERGAAVAVAVGNIR
jgi:hypothetical protein